MDVQSEVTARPMLPPDRQAVHSQITEAELWWTGHRGQEKWQAARTLPTTASDLLTEAMVAQDRCRELERILGEMVDAHEACAVADLASAASEAIRYLGRVPQEDA